MFTHTHAVSSRVYEEAAIAGEACPATTLGITSHNKIVRKNAWTMVNGTSVCRDGLGNVGKRSMSAWAPRKDMEEVLEMKNAGRKPSQGATIERDRKSTRNKRELVRRECVIIHIVTHQRWPHHHEQSQESQQNYGRGYVALQSRLRLRVVLSR